MYTYLKMR